MNPLSIIGSAMGVAFIAGLVYLVPVGMRAYNGMVADGELSRIEVALSLQQREHDKEMKQNADAAETHLDEVVAGLEAEALVAKEKNDEQARTINNLLDQDPLAVDASIARDFYVGMCEVAAGNNLGAREACHIRAAKADFASGSAVISVTEKTIADWAELCATTGSDDYCKPRVIGFKPLALIELKGWIGDVDRTLRNQDANFDTVIDQINQILEMPGPTIGERP